MPDETPVRELRLALTVDDLDAALAVFRDALGLQVSETWGDGDERGYVLPAGHATIELLSPGEAARVDAVEGSARPAGPVRVALHVGDSAAVAEALVAAGAERLGEPVLTPWNHRNVRLAAPGGLQLTLFSET
jgi:catechol 2,3-dioxygenase-like lactoylglutathione lyase family enzyme